MVKEKHGVVLNEGHQHNKGAKTHLERRKSTRKQEVKRVPVSEKKVEADVGIKLVVDNLVITKDQTATGRHQSPGNEAVKNVPAFGKQEDGTKIGGPDVASANDVGSSKESGGPELTTQLGLAGQ